MLQKNADLSTLLFSICSKASNISSGISTTLFLLTLAEPNKLLVIGVSSPVNKTDDFGDRMLEAAA
jgi:hypothetical protein